MKTQAKKQTQKIILMVGAFFMFTSSVCSPVWGLEIRQDLYIYSVINTPVQIPIHQTFVIARQPSFYARPESRPFPVAYFDLGSAWLSPDDSSKLLMDLRECCAACPLYLTGYTCSLGVENQNQKLSRHRAESVAALLRRNGYKVDSVEGKGMIYGSNPESNRRVEINLSKK
jgi:outer membrane protein OmpA-like peptidoglycan-associated protein